MSAEEKAVIVAAAERAGQTPGAWLLAQGLAAGGQNQIDPFVRE